MDLVVVSQTQISRFLEHINNCTIMADRGFKHIERLLSERQCKLVRPPSVSEGTILQESDTKTAKQIAALRIQIERVIKRIREFKMVETHSRINLHYLGLLDEIMIIVCGIINTQGPLIK